MATLACFRGPRWQAILATTAWAAKAWHAPREEQARSGSGGDRFGARRGGVGGRPGQAEDEPRQADDVGVPADLAAVLARQPPRRRQAQAAAPPRLAAGEERVEDVL